MNTQKYGIWHRILEGFTAMAFAEAGEFDTAKDIIKQADLGLKKSLTFWERAMAAVAFAEAGEFETAKKWLKKDEEEVEVKSRSIENIIEASIENAAATAFAEAGEHYQAIQIIGRLKGKKLLVVCEGEELPERLMKQGIEMAEKMGLELIVLNIFTHTTSSRPSAQRDTWREEFQRRAEENLEPWKKRRPGLRISQMVKFGDPTRILQEVLLKVQGIRYILSLKELVPLEQTVSTVSVPHFISLKH